MSESEPKKPTPEKKGILYNVLLETLDLAERGREAFSKWQKRREEKREREERKIERADAYCALIECIEEPNFSKEFKQSRIDEFNKKYDTNHTLDSFT